MGKVYPHLDGALQGFIEDQHMFFVASAPLAADGLVNLSPKGLDSFRVLTPSTVAFLDLGGSGIETLAHCKENGRIVFLFCAFEGPPRILRLYGTGEAIEPGHPEWNALLAEFPEYPHPRSIIRAELTRIADSCGFAVPLYEYQSQRDQLVRYNQTLGEEVLAEKRNEHNATSLDGLPGLTPR